MPVGSSVSPELAKLLQDHLDKFYRGKPLYICIQLTADCLR